jgi:hypothetical protein
MGRPQRAAEGGYVYHVLNRANARVTIFERDADYEAFEKVERTKTRPLAYCIMPNHWHLVLWPTKERGAQCAPGESGSPCRAVALVQPGPLAARLSGRQDTVGAVAIAT